MTLHLDQALTAALRELERQAAERGRVVRVQNPRGINIPFPVNLKLVLEVALMSAELAPRMVTPSCLLRVEDGG
jgi:hypothetical protein